MQRVILRSWVTVSTGFFSERDNIDTSFKSNKGCNYGGGGGRSHVKFNDLLQFTIVTFKDIAVQNCNIMSCCTSKS